MNRDESATAVDGGDDLVGADGVGECAREGDVDRAVAEERGAGDDGVRSGREHVLRALDAANTAADAAGQPPADGRDHRRVVAASTRGVEVDQLDARKAGEALDPRLGVGRFDGEPLALHELHDVAVLEID